MTMTTVKRAELPALICAQQKLLAALNLMHDESRAGCSTCTFFGGGMSCHKWGAEVPAQAQAAGCDEWVYSSIPF